MNIWRRGPLSRNPYHYTAFRMTRVPRDATDRALVVDLVSQIRQLSEADPEAHQVKGQPVNESELNQAELVLLDPRRRIIEELLEHQVEVPAQDRLEGLIRQVVAQLCGAEQLPMPWINRHALVEWTAEYCRLYLKQEPPGDPTFGAAELELVPPWGRSGA